MSDDVANKLQTLDITSPIPSPALPPQTVQGLNGLDLDLTLPTALSSLINHLLAPLAKLYPPETLAALRVYLDSTLTELYTPSWDVEHPQHGSGFRSLICDADRGLPRPLRKCAQAAGVKEAVWRKALARPVGNDADEEGRGRRDLWEAWCDPGTVIWRYGAWEWEDHGFEVTKVIREPFTLVWQSSSSPRLAVPSTSTTTSGDNVTSPGVGTTPARASRAIPIRAPIPLPAVFAIPPTPANHHPSTVPDHDSSSSATLLPSFALARTPSPAHSDLSWSRDSAYFSSCAENDENQPRGSSTPMMSTSKPINASHRGSGTGSTSSVASSVSEASAAQLLTPGSRPPSADPFGGPISSKSPTPTQTHPGSQTAPPLRGRTPSPSGPRDSTTPGGATSTTPTVTPYDGGNVTVMGGGVKLGGGGGASRPSSVMSQNRQTYDRSRSPSISLASRALTSALGPNANGGARKVRTRRRIMPTYLGHLGQPGVGGPIMGPFGSLQPSGPVYGGNPPTWPGVGVGMAPPPIPRTGTPRISSA